MAITKEKAPPAAQFAEMLARSCDLQGISLYKVNPSYSSVGGYAKYGKQLRLDPDRAASIWLARQALYGAIYRTKGDTFGPEA